MEVIYKSDNKVFYINDEEYLTSGYSYGVPSIIDDIPDLKDANILYHYREVVTCSYYPVYYEYKDSIISHNTVSYCLYYIGGDELVKDYTLVNLEILENI